MNCRLFHDNLIGYLENTASPDLRLLMDDHLKSCIHCQNILQEVNLTYGSWNGSEPEVNPFFYTRLEQKLKNKLEHQTASALVWRFRTVVATCLMVISIGVGVFIGKNISLQNTASSVPGREEVLQSYASDYYLSSASDDNVYNLTMNE